MKKRGEQNLVRDLRKALTQGELEYAAIKGEEDSGTYAGLQYRRFGVSEETLP